MMCVCPDWAPGVEKINGPIITASIRAGRDLYDGKPFKFCPWCGSKLVEYDKRDVRTQDSIGALHDP
jgi:hypothetical protein